MYNYLLILSALWPAKFGAVLKPLEELESKWAAVEPRLMEEATVESSNAVVRVDQLASNVLCADIAAVRKQHADDEGGEQPAGEADDHIRAGQAVAVMAAAQPSCAELFASNLRAVRDMVRLTKKKTTVEGDSDDREDSSDVEEGGDDDDAPAGPAGATDEPMTDSGDAPAADAGASTAPADGAEGASGPDSAVPRQPAPIKTGREEEPLNEYDDNAALLRGAFFHLFIAPPLPIDGKEDGVDSLVGRSGKGGVAGLSKPAVQHLLRQHTGSFGREKHLLFLLFNQIQRRSAARAVSALLNDNPQAFSVFQARLYGHPALLVACAAVSNLPVSTESAAC